MADWSSKNPYMSTITENYVLNGEGSRKETRHIAFDLGDSGLTYKVGDALGVMAQNPPHIVDELIEVQGWDADEMVITHNGEKRLWDALKCDFEVHMANKKFVASLAEKVVSGQIRIKSTIMRRVRNGAEIDAELPAGEAKDDPVSTVEKINSSKEEVEDYLWTRDYIDIMREFDVKYSPQEFMELADRLKPRLYSISSSLDAHPGLVELTVGIVRFEYNNRPRGGLCTLYLADEIGTTGNEIGVFMSPTKSFVLPEDKSIDIMMVGPGTGIAPFRAFMEQRVHDKATIEEWVNNGDLYKFTTAWSRDQEKKIYVQDRLRENGPEVWEWFDSGAYFYICGDKSRMAKDVHNALIDIVEEYGEMSRDDAVHYVEKKMMREEKRYLRDVY